jgi:hypothetical protein
MDGDKDAPDAREIDLTRSIDGMDPDSAEKSRLLSDLQSPLIDIDGSDDDGNALTRLKERFDDARDALLESDAGARVADISGKVGNFTIAAWALSKKAAWIVGTSALVLIVPLLYEMDKELNSGASLDGSPEKSGAEAGVADSGAKSSDSVPAAE